MYWGGFLAYNTLRQATGAHAIQVTPSLAARVVDSAALWQAHVRSTLLYLRYWIYVRVSTSKVIVCPVLERSRSITPL